MTRLQFLGREFLGIASAASSGDTNTSLPSSSFPVVIGFPKLKKLEIDCCLNLKEWEDITAEEEGSATVSIMPCLKELEIRYCGLTELPYRLLRKASSLQHLKITSCTDVSKRYKDKEGSGRISLSHIPHVEVEDSPVQSSLHRRRQTGDRHAASCVMSEPEDTPVTQPPNANHHNPPDSNFWSFVAFVFPLLLLLNLTEMITDRKACNWQEYEEGPRLNPPLPQKPFN
ncbi:hypothetical protein BUALT_Bualt07G0156400 [Buddleja alternifolia]|uniref:Uncharacterized protein n=1 Tax=Buddleja alternifolia TaxID=168488 RepID=A0AAV6XLL6_9LAMI|nr:hypothetical protein BUALT_Bualt07G0156400 [Buddleja alternifolia]